MSIAKSRNLTCVRVVVTVLAALAFGTPSAQAKLGRLVRTFLQPPHTGGNNMFGASVAALGNNVIIGTVESSSYLYDGSTGNKLLTFNNPAWSSHDEFGKWVAAAGGNVIIGAPSSDPGALLEAGAAYLFNGSTGAVIRSFTSPAPTADAHFGCSVAGLGNNVLIGAYWDDRAAVNGGAAYLFNGSTGALMRTFVCPAPAAADGFGYAIAPVGNNVLIGSPYDHRGIPGGQSPGAAYLFDGSTGALRQTFLNPTPASNDYFGRSVAAMGNNVLIGAPYDDAGASNSGAAYLFDGSTGALLRTFLNPTPGAGDYFGCSLAAVGEDILIGAYGADTSNGYDGVAYLFDGASGHLLWTSVIDSSFFGYSVAALGNKMLIGAPKYMDSSFNVNGAAYLFETPEPATLAMLTCGAAALLGRRPRARA